MLNKLPAWISFGSFLLSFVAGLINAFMLAGLLGEPVSHLTGPSSNLALALASGNIARVLHLGLLILSFVAGSTLSGMIIRDSHLKLGRRYGVVLLLESFMLLIVVIIFDRHPHSSQYILALVCGLQNAMATTYSGAIIRTTHLSGIFTDLGIVFGHWLTGVAFDRVKAGLHGLLISGFITGGIVAGLLTDHWGEGVLIIPMLVTGVLGVSYFLFWLHRRHTLKVNPQLPLPKP